MPLARRTAPLLLTLLATLLVVGGALYPRPRAVEDAARERAARLARLEALARGASPGDSIRFVYCGDPAALSEHLYLAQYAFAPARVDTATSQPADRRILLDAAERCPAGVLRALGAAGAVPGPTLLVPGAADR